MSDIRLLLPKNSEIVVRCWTRRDGNDGGSFQDVEFPKVRSRSPPVIHPAFAQLARLRTYVYQRCAQSPVRVHAETPETCTLSQTLLGLAQGDLGPSQRESPSLPDASEGSPGKRAGTNRPRPTFTCTYVTVTRVTPSKRCLSRPNIMRRRSSFCVDGGHRSWITCSSVLLRPVWTTAVLI